MISAHRSTAAWRGQEGKRISFFQLTPGGAEYVRRYFTVREDVWT